MKITDNDIANYKKYKKNINLKKNAMLTENVSKTKYEKALLFKILVHKEEMKLDINSLKKFNLIEEAIQTPKTLLILLNFFTIIMTIFCFSCGSSSYSLLSQQPLIYYTFVIMFVFMNIYVLYTTFVFLKIKTKMNKK